MFKMKKIIISSSSDDDDPYANSVVRLKKLKRKRFEREKLSVKKEDLSSINIEQRSNTETDFDGIQTRSRTVKSKKLRQNNIKQIRQMHPSIDHLESDIEIVSMRKKSKIAVFSNSDVFTLSDDNAYNEDENYEINVKILWRSSRIDRLSMHRHDSFQKIFQHYANLEKVSIDEILIMKKDKIVNRTDTPASLKLSIIDILDGGIVNPGMNILSENKNNDNTCSIKIQTANKKQSLTILLQRTQRFKILLANCAEQLGIKESNLKLYFDGEQISLIDTPESLDLEEEACVDLHIST